MKRPRASSRTIAPLPLRLLAHAALLSPLVLGSGCLTSGIPLAVAAVEINKTRSPEHVVLQEGDLLEIHFAEEEEWNHQTRVRLDGKATFLLVDEIQVAGRTLEQLDALLEERYKKHLVDPKLSVLVAEAAPRTVTVMGEVQAPGKIPFEGKRLSFLDAIGAAGGPNIDTCVMRAALLIRWVPEEQKQRVWKINAHWDYWGEGPPIYLQPYDIIYIPNAPIVDADIWVDRYIRRLIPLPGGAGFIQ